MVQPRAFVAAIVGAFFIIAVGVIPRVIADQSTAKPGEAVVTFEDPSYAEQGAVQFSHLAHKESFGAEKLDCKPCHIQPKLFPMKRKPGEVREMVKMEAMAGGQACGACHNGKTKVNDKVVFSVANKESCGLCHKKK